jgi:catechol 2,3-dioxygenase-like lactoylglutathione lyase family enzyme
MTVATDVHHIAIGVRDLDRMREFYAQRLGFTKVAAEFQGVSAPVMSEVARVNLLVFDGAILEHEQGGVQLEFIKRTAPPPRPMRVATAPGDIGFNVFTIVATDPASVAAGLDASAGVVRCASGVFHLRDPEGNLIRIEAPAAGSEPGARGVSIGVVDLDAALGFYRRLLGASIEVSPASEEVVDIPMRDGARTALRLRSVRLQCAGRRSWVELTERLQARGRSIPFGANWGDFGYLQVCFSCPDVKSMATALPGHGAELLCAPHAAGPGPADKVGEFVYARDIDGALLEFLFLPS